MGRHIAGGWNCCGDNIYYFQTRWQKISKSIIIKLKNNSMNKFLTGALLGLVAGLLIAPQKGEELREDLADTADKWKDKFNRLVGRAETSLDDLKMFLDKNIDGLSD